MISITKQFEFEAAHKLDWHKGKCKNLHGHTYKLLVTIKPGTKIGKNGVVMDFGKLKEIVEKEIIEELDHKYLNDIIENPTAENIAYWIFMFLESKLPISVYLSKVKLYETPTSYVELSRTTIC